MIKLTGRSINYSSLFEKITQNYTKVSSLLPGGFALPPLRTTIELTYSCNLNCQMCFQKNFRKQHRQKNLTVKEITTLVNQISPHTLITFTGGEIFTRKDTYKVIAHATKRHFVNLITNATLIDSKLANKLVSLPIKLIGISLDGPENIHDQIRGLKGSFQKTVKAINLIQAIKKRKRTNLPLIDLKTVILPQNQRYLADLFLLAENLKADYITYSSLKLSPYQFTPFLSDSLSPKQLQEKIAFPKILKPEILTRQLRNIKKLSQNSKTKARFYPNNFGGHIKSFFNISQSNFIKPCLYPYLGLNITPHGNIYPCLGINMGNIKGQNLSSIWNSPKYRNFRRMIKRNKNLPACLGCCYQQFN